MQVSLSSWSGYYSWCGTEGKYEIGGDKLETMIECTALGSGIIQASRRFLQIHTLEHFPCI